MRLSSLFAERLFFILFPFLLYVQFAIASSAFTNSVFYALVVPAWLYYLWRNRADVRTMLAEPAIRWALAFFAFVALHATLTSLFYGYPGGSKIIRNSLATTLFFMAAASFFGFADDRTKEKTIRTIGLVSGLCAVLSIGIYLATAPHKDPRMIPLGRADTQVLAAFIYGFGGLCALRAMAVASGSRIKWLLAACILADFCAILLTQSRMAEAAFMFCILLGSWLFFPENRRVCWWLAGLMTLVILAGIPLLLGVSAYDYLLALVERGDSFRMELWQLTAEKIQAQPWIGSGVLARIDHPVTHSPHNLFLATAMSVGLPGLALLLTTLAIPCWRTLRGLRAQPLQLGFIGLLLLLGMSSALIDHSRIVKGPSPLWFIFWMPVAFAVGELIASKRRAG